MITYAPSYYPSFKCIAGACKHSCCIGWEIDIDCESLEKYREVPGEFGARLNLSIDGSSFKLDDNERCPFLNRDGLCDLILNLGEEALCQICTDHPRFRSFFPSRTELGLGMCCEAAAELILSSREEFRLIPISGQAEPASEFEDVFFSFRQSLFDTLTRRDISLDARIAQMLGMCRAKLPEKSLCQWSEIYLNLERLDPEWGKVLEGLKAADIPPLELSDELECAFEQLAVYFIYRHVSPAFDLGDLVPRVLLAALSVHIIKGICAAHCIRSIPALAEIARMYSSEIEYSEDNVSALLDILS